MTTTIALNVLQIAASLCLVVVSACAWVAWRKLDLAAQAYSRALVEMKEDAAKIAARAKGTT